MVPRRLFLGVAVLFVAQVAGARTAQAVDEPNWTWAPASAANYRKDGARQPDMIVLHKIEGSYGSCVNWFRNPAAKVSAHWVVAHSGDMTHMVQDRDVAWHAGNAAVNARSIGIENEGYTYRDDVPDGHLRALAHLVAWLCQQHGIRADRQHIIGHDEVPDPNRPGHFGGAGGHTDPGPYFDWATFMNYVRGYLGQAPAPNPAPKPAPNPAPAAGAVRAVAVTAGSLNVRTAAWGAVIGSANASEVFVRTGRTDGDFVEIWYAGRRGFVHSAYVSGAKGTGAKVITGSLNVRTGASVAFGNIGQVHQDEHYADADAGTAGWRHIYFDHRKEWIFRAYTNDVVLAP